ncbi:unnamed protein product [Plutella xylostella]|uniref:NADH dehydrogenase [ubiquinone] 1 alpha subcomplex subunit 11 n=1 Tax=Plutella xylostella TaxID=51655 RepID=A0A8S4G7M6_PLUXY|nr:unnamed protein product [Plutella xylostella]
MSLEGPGKPRNHYTYYDTPDGQDIDKKMLVCARYGAIAGTIAGTYDVLMYSHAKGFGRVLRRYALHVAPLAAMGAVFAAVANGVQRVRGEDDQLNYFWVRFGWWFFWFSGEGCGGVACGPILALYLGSGHAVVAGGLALGAAGMVKKLSVDSGVALLPMHSPHLGSVDGWRKDYSLVRDPKEGHVCRECVPQNQDESEKDSNSSGSDDAGANNTDDNNEKKKKC